jgi:hypothetical protein
MLVVKPNNPPHQTNNKVKGVNKKVNCDVKIGLYQLCGNGSSGLKSEQRGEENFTPQSQL